MQKIVLLKCILRAAHDRLLCSTSREQFLSLDIFLKSESFWVSHENGQANRKGGGVSPLVPDPFLALKFDFLKQILSHIPVK